jgi:tousled-like kinase
MEKIKDHEIREEEPNRDENGFLRLNNPDEFKRISEIWCEEKKSEVKIKLDCEKKENKKEKNLQFQELEKKEKHSERNIKFFETFNEMTEHLKDKKAENDKKISEKKIKNKEKKSSNSLNRTKRKKDKKKKHLKQNLEDHQVKKIQTLTKQIEEQNKRFQEYSQKMKDVLRYQILKNEENLKQKKIRKLKLAKERLGEFMLREGMSKTKEVWVDGGNLKDIKERLKKIQVEKEIREKFRKCLNRRKPSKVSANEISLGEFKSAKESKSLKCFLTKENKTSVNPKIKELPRHPIEGMIEPTMTPGLLFNPHMSPSLNMLSSFDKSSHEFSKINQYEFTHEEAKDLVKMQITFLNKEENFLKDQLEVLEIEKKEYLREIRQLYDEENCQFISTFNHSVQEDSLWNINRRSSNKKTNIKLGLTNYEEMNYLKSNKWPLLNNRYQLVSLLGKGGFSEVFKAYDLKLMKYVACKIHQLNSHWSLTSRSNYIKHALRENQVHRFLKHLNIVEHYDSVEINSTAFCTILEYCNGPSLSTYLKIHKTLNEKEAKMIIKQILSGLLFLNQKHDAKIIHYDLKPQNILFNNGIPKISDFGLCKIMNNDETKLELTSQGVGTYYYLPPECFIRDKVNPILISAKVDIWSLGVIFFEMLYGFRPFGHNLSQERIFKDGIMLKAYSVTFPNRPNVSEKTKDFIRKALAYHQEDRIDVTQAHKILNSK